MRAQDLVAGSVIVILACAGPKCWSASFDCGSSELTIIEKSICGDGTLSALDSRLASRYSTLKDAASALENWRLVAEERAWIADRDLCSTTECLLDSYTKRIADLSPGNAMTAMGNPDTHTSESVATPRAAQNPADVSVSGGAAMSGTTTAAVGASAHSETPTPTPSQAAGNSGSSETVLGWAILAGMFLLLCIVSQRFRRNFLSGG